MVQPFWRQYYLLALSSRRIKIKSRLRPLLFNQTDNWLILLIRLVTVSLIFLMLVTLQERK